MDKTKRCIHCGEIKPLTVEFFPTRNRRSIKNPGKAFITICILCRRIESRKWANTHRDSVRERKRIDYHARKNTPEFQIKERARRIGVSVDVVRVLWSNWVCSICGVGG